MNMNERFSRYLIDLVYPQVKTLDNGCIKAYMANPSFVTAHRVLDYIDDYDFKGKARLRSPAYCVQFAIGGMMEDAVYYAELSLDTEYSSIWQHFVSTWTDEDLKITDPEWIDYATAEIFSRAA